MEHGPWLQSASMIRSSGLVNFGRDIAFNHSRQLIYYSRGPYARAFLCTKTCSTPPTASVLSGERMAAALSTPPGAPTSFQRRVPRLRGNGRGGKRNRNIGGGRRANRNWTGKAGA